MRCAGQPQVATLWPEDADLDLRAGPGLAPRRAQLAHASDRLAAIVHTRGRSARGSAQPARVEHLGAARDWRAFLAPAWPRRCGLSARQPTVRGMLHLFVAGLIGTPAPHSPPGEATANRRPPPIPPAPRRAARRSCDTAPPPRSQSRPGFVRAVLDNSAAVRERPRGPPRPHHALRFYRQDPRLLLTTFCSRSATAPDAATCATSNRARSPARSSATTRPTLPFTEPSATSSPACPIVTPETSSLA